jgi:hypothetical protein
MAEGVKVQLFREIVESPIGGNVFKDKEGTKHLQGYSFIIKSATKTYVDGRQYELWFQSQAAARECANDVMRRVMDQLRQQGQRVEGFTQ